MEQQQLDGFIARYVGMWHEPDAQRRRAIVQDLWAADGENRSRRFAIQGHEAIVARVARAHDDWVAKKGFVFRPAGNADALGNVVKFLWEMVPKGGGAREALGLDIFLLHPDGRIRALYQFAEPLPA
ncbi:MAG TPA: hypothetical protein VLW55_18365 [Burkholderiaceae bacterium]|nr:hypothetical protein [Burkholderiaceae bacterium]